MVLHRQIQIHCDIDSFLTVGMMIFPSFVMDPYFHSCLCLLLNSNVELLSFGKSGKISTFIVVGGVCSSIMFPIGVSMDKSSRRFFSSMESNAKECSLTRVPLARFALRFMLCVRYDGQFGTKYS